MTIAERNIFPKKKSGQIYIQTWHGTFITKKIEADAELPEGYIKIAKRDSSAIDYLLSSGKKRTEQFKRCFWYTGEIEETGSPRDDILFDKNAKSEIKRKICDFYDLDIEKHIMLYVPTFRNSHSLEPYCVDYEKLLSALKKSFGGEWQIITRLHPNMISFADKLNLPEFVINATLYSDMQELLCASDAVLTDYSSMGDYSIYLKPLFMFCTDIDGYQKERGLQENLESLPFPIARNNQELYENIVNFDKLKYEEKLSAYYKAEGFCENGNASEKVMQLIKRRQTEKKIDF